LTIRTNEEQYPRALRPSNKRCQILTVTHPQHLEAATDRAIAACVGDARQAVTALIVANEFLEAQVAKLQAAVSNGYAHGKFEAVPRDRKDWYD
jgi:hypothetical protein